jgi:hypothetical protein
VHYKGLFTQESKHGFVGHTSTVDNQNLKLLKYSSTSAKTLFYFISEKAIMLRANKHKLRRHAPAKRKWCHNPGTRDRQQEINYLGKGYTIS